MLTSVHADRAHKKCGRVPSGILLPITWICVVKASSFALLSSFSSAGIRYTNFAHG